jgi:hypothetical protein
MNQPNRTLATATGLSYGFVHQVLTESGVQLRPWAVHESEASNNGKAAKLPARLAGSPRLVEGSPLWQRGLPSGGLRSGRGARRPPRLPCQRYEG